MSQSIPLASFDQYLDFLSWSFRFARFTLVIYLCMNKPVWFSFSLFFVSVVFMKENKIRQNKRHHLKVGQSKPTEGKELQ